MLKFSSCFIFFLSLYFSLLISDCYAQLGGTGNRIEGKRKFLPIPYLNYDRSIGFTVGAVPMLMFNPSEKDTISPSSIVGLLGIYTTNETWMVMGFGKFYVNEDNWRFTGAGGTGTFNFQFYLNNPIFQGWIPYGTDVDFVYAQAERRVWDKLYAGVSYIYTGFTTRPGEGEILADTSAIHGIGLNLSLDRRSSVYYPRSGYLTNATYYGYPDWLNDQGQSQKIELDFNAYFSNRSDKDVIAARFFAGFGIGELNFNQQFIVSEPDLRGYSQGKFRGNYQVAVQGEYRWNFLPRMGAVGFFGLTTLFDAINEDDDGKILPGIGTGFRYVMQEDTNFIIGMDIAAGVDDWGIYFRLGEAF